MQGLHEFNRGVNEFNRGVNEVNRGVNRWAAVTSAVTSQGCCCGNLQIHPLDLGQSVSNFALKTLNVYTIQMQDIIGYN